MARRSPRTLDRYRCARKWAGVASGDRRGDGRDARNPGNKLPANKFPANVGIADFAGDAAMLYRMRRGIETCYRHVKRTMQGHKLHAAAARQAQLELQGLIAALTCLGLMSIRRRVERNEDPLRWSAARALATAWKLMHELAPVAASAARAARDVWRLFAQAVIDWHRRVCKVRQDWPRKNAGRTPPAAPHQRPARIHKIQLAQTLDHSS